MSLSRSVGVFRRIANNANEDGKTVTYFLNWIKIDDDVYQASDISQIPKKYMSDETRKPVPKCNQGIAAAAGGGDSDVETDQEQENSAKYDFESDPNVKIKLTKSGLTFPGPTAFVSSMSLVDGSTPECSSPSSIGHCGKNP